jgi:catalase
MPKKTATKAPARPPASATAKGRQRRDVPADPNAAVGPGGELHQTAGADGTPLTTNQGLVISDDQNSLRIGARGPSLLEDFVLREKITHFDHERIPERIVHARGSGAHGYFQPKKSLAKLTRAAFLQDPKVRTPVFVRFSTVAGGAGSVDLPRDVRGFAVKFYTSEGIFDLVGNNIPVFFIQDAMKFPDLVHAVKMEPDRAFPQAASAHATFWDFVSLMPESMHMLMWAMSDRTIPRSLRFMEGFGVHTFRMIDASGHSTFVKFHWRPRQGAQSVLWPEAVAINGADQDYHRRDLWEAIERGDYPQFDLAIQAFDEETAAGFPFDVLDATKLIPEELVPLEVIGTLTLDRNPDNFFAETEQVAFHPGHVVPGIDFSNDPLLQGRLFSYLDTQLSRLGGPNFHELPINRPKCPMQNFQRDGISRMDIPKGRVNYEPNSLDPKGPRESAQGFTSYPSDEGPDKVRERAETFADHYSQARMFWRSMTAIEQAHIVGAYTFELGKVEILDIRRRMLGHLDIIAPELGKRVADGLGMPGTAQAITPARAPIDMDPSPALSILDRYPPSLSGRTVAVLVADGSDAATIAALRTGLTEAGARLAVVAPRIAGVHGSDREPIAVDHALAGAPSCLFDAVAIVIAEGAAPVLEGDPDAVDWVRDAFHHCKVIGYSPAAAGLLDRGRIAIDEGVVAIGSAKAAAKWIARAKGPRVFAREPAR